MPNEVDEMRTSQPSQTPQQQSLKAFRRLLERHFYKPDWQALRIVFSTMQAHYLNVGDPAWLFVIAPPGGGKTTTSIMGAADLREIVLLSDVTENTFLSGFYGHKQPGLLEKLGETSTVGNTQTTNGDAILLVKDFTTVLSMRREKRGAILSQLREIHDGMFKRDFGTGQTKIWRGRATVVAAVTPIIDRHYSIFTSLGERFLQVRWHRPDSEEAGEWAIRQQGQEGEIRKRLCNAVSAIFKNALKESAPLSADMQKRIASLAEIVALSRTHVFRDGYSREIEYIPEPEANTRIAKQLAAIARGAASISGHGSVTDEEFEDVRRVAFDCLTETRRRLFEAILRGENASNIFKVQAVRDRELQDLEALEVVKEVPQNTNSESKDEPREFTPRLQRLLTAAGVAFSRSVRDVGNNTGSRDGEISNESSPRADTSEIGSGRNGNGKGLVEKVLPHKPARTVDPNDPRLTSKPMHVNPEADAYAIHGRTRGRR